MEGTIESVQQCREIEDEERKMVRQVDGHYNGREPFE